MLEHADKATYLFAFHQNGGGRAVQGSEAGGQFVSPPSPSASREPVRMDQWRWQHTSSSFALPKPPTPPSLADPPRVRNLSMRMSSPHRLAIVADRYLGVRTSRSMVTSMRLEWQSMLIWRNLSTQLHRQSAYQPWLLRRTLC